MCFDDRRLIGPKEEIEREATDLEGAGCDVSKFIRLPPTLPASWFYVSRDWVYGRDPEPYCTAKLMPMIAIFVAERSGHPLVCDECGEKHDHDGDAFSRVCCASFLLATLPTGTQLPPLNEVE
jgi:hypothetical protein